MKGGVAGDPGEDDDRTYVRMIGSSKPGRLRRRGQMPIIVVTIISAKTAQTENTRASLGQM